MKEKRAGVLHDCGDGSIKSWVWVVRNPAGHTIYSSCSFSRREAQEYCASMFGCSWTTLYGRGFRCVKATQWLGMGW